jgi:hypothetical protein
MKRENALSCNISKLINMSCNEKATKMKMIEWVQNLYMVTQDQLTKIDFVEDCPGKPAEKVKSRI